MDNMKTLYLIQTLLCRVDGGILIVVKLHSHSVHKACFYGLLVGRFGV